VSGPGSTKQRASAFRQEFESLLRAHKVTSILDAPCVDSNWLPNFTLDGIRIIGDIVPELVAANLRRNTNANVRFMAADPTC